MVMKNASVFCSFGDFSNVLWTARVKLNATWIRLEIISHIFFSTWVNSSHILKIKDNIRGLLFFVFFFLFLKISIWQAWRYVSQWNTEQGLFSAWGGWQTWPPDLSHAEISARKQQKKISLFLVHIW